MNRKIFFLLILNCLVLTVLPINSFAQNDYWSAVRQDYLNRSDISQEVRDQVGMYNLKSAEQSRSIYRYLMQHEVRKLVPLADEIQFARTYRELIQIRFPEGLVLEDRVGADIPHGYIIPCTLQLLLENAIKHNAISPENPLIVSVSTDGKSITMRNTRIPKVSTRPSTGIGLQYIRNQYRDLADAEITVTQTLDSFAVTVPILDDSK
jgi:LytS/YehU family sensor histidine kinase